MKKTILILVMGLLLTSCSKESKQVTLDCEGMIVDISNGKMCFIVPTEGETLCAEVETHNSKIIKTISLHKNTSALAYELMSDSTHEREFYIKIDRKIGTLGFFMTDNNENASAEGKLVSCKKKEGL